MYNFIYIQLCIMYLPFLMIIDNHREKSNASRFYSIISVYFVTVIIKRLVWQVVSNASGSPLQKVGGGGHAHPVAKLGGGANCPPAPLAPASLKATDFGWHLEGPDEMSKVSLVIV